MAVDLHQAFDDFLLSCEADGLSPATIKWYRSLILAFVNESQPCRLDQVTARDVRQYIASLRQRDNRYVDAPQKPAQEGGLSAATIAGHITALHAFWAWSTREYDLDANPMANIKRARRRTPVPKFLDPADFVSLFNATGEDEVGDRDRAILCFLADTGCRLQGIRSLKMEHLYLDIRKATVWEKGSVSRQVVYTRYTSEVLQRWLSRRMAVTDYVFYSFMTEDALSDSGINQILKRLKKKAGVKGRVNPHSFRHNFAREYIKNGGDLATLARLLGHRDISTTVAYYAVFSPDELAELHEKYSPLVGVEENLH